MIKERVKLMSKIGNHDKEETENIQEKINLKEK